MGARRRESGYTVLARELRTQILQGRYADGRRLPTEAELAERYRVSRQTVRRAFQDLVAEGMVYRVPGRGTFATPRRERGYLRQFGSIDDLMGLSADTRMQIIAPLRRRVDVNAAGRLRLPDDVVHVVVFRRLHEGTPFCVTTVALPPGVARSLASVPELTAPGATSDQTIIGLLDARLKAPIAEAEQSITVALADDETAEHLGCDPGHPLLKIDRLYLDTTGAPVELAVSHFLPELHSYRTNLRRSIT
ncbi:GntR family transcriptional regulator [Actinomadura hallensis]|uniref:GntR family transcriptional regulator n=1 Tax=Actinomadura hallensis TaxID=337895 RepID=A0A543IGA8_9ACTN|nr:GntR family transcriptional regulator [Actinomadura hallensis]TQM69615.1 GntR family transcriptional regulator [Actinomadura hallensis]HLV73245.1 GntR family transcriptional regulator [Vulgatibacteraceae bacterium]